jgi:hypothetical protein
MRKADLARALADHEREQAYRPATRAAAAQRQTPDTSAVSRSCARLSATASSNIGRF